MPRSRRARRVGAHLGAAACLLLAAAFALSSQRSLIYSGDTFRAGVSHGTFTLLVQLGSGRFQRGWVSYPRGASMDWSPEWVLRPPTGFVIVPLWIPLLPAAAATLYLYLTSRPLPPWRCPRCGYDRRGAPTPICPECGHAAASRDPGER